MLTPILLAGPGSVSIEQFSVGLYFDAAVTDLLRTLRGTNVIPPAKAFDSATIAAGSVSV